MNNLTHIDETGAARMVDVGGKPATRRKAVAEATVHLDAAALTALLDGTAPKGNVYETARLAGVLAAKRTPDLIPLCHPLLIDHIGIDFEIRGDRLVIHASCTVTGKTGVEMEALAAASVAALTVYDMLKAVSHAITIEGIRLLEKSGGKSGDWHALDQEIAS
ncbi:cyclic pyranopterin monophosphate synthase MoaC [bacterium]|nr:cyclic pyranopterin monophosphate synthase MoaC [bacterium]